uniref:G-protein coupled receptors family 1 profile domain-containing protein n=1 Tax=Maylandia zebra TaxID=106582 RepID=A0A3P9DQ89_9CICH
MESLGQQMNRSNLGKMTGTDEVLIKCLVPILDGLILLTGLIGQTLVIIILTRRRRKQNQPPHSTDILLLVLSAADLLLLLCLPFHTSAITLGFWPFGGFLCKAISFLGVTCSVASVFTMAALAVTRYLTVVHPTWAFRLRMHRRIKLTVALVVQCFAFLSDFSQLVYSIALFLFGFALPLGIIIMMYAKIYCFLRYARQVGNASQLERYQRQVTHTSALLVAVFTILWLPSYVLMFSLIGGHLKDSSGNKVFAIVARLLATSVGVVNPVLYSFVSQKFRRDLLELGRRQWARCRNCSLLVELQLRVHYTGSSRMGQHSIINGQDLKKYGSKEQRSRNICQQRWGSLKSSKT